MGAWEVYGLSAVTAGLGSLAQVGVEVSVADELVVAHPLASRVDNVDKQGIGLVQSLARGRRMK